MQRLSVIVPCYNEELSIPLFFREVRKVEATLPQLEFEYIFVDDGSADGTLRVLRELSASCEQVRYLAFSRNFGKEAAMYAGLQAATGALAVIMDVDLQDPPSLLPEMYRLITEEEYDCAAARRVSRKGDPPVRSFFARMFYRIMRKMSRTEIMDGARDYRMMTRQMVDSILSLAEYNRFSKGIFAWVGYRTAWLEFENVERAAGESKWSFFSLLRYAIEGIVAFSTVPLAAASVLGILFCVISFLAIIFVVVRQLIWGGSAYGWPSLVCIILFLTGVQLFCMGIIGQYLSRTYLEVKKRPIYVLRETGGGKEHEK